MRKHPIHRSRPKHRQERKKNIKKENVDLQTKKVEVLEETIEVSYEKGAKVLAETHGFKIEDIYPTPGQDYVSVLDVQRAIDEKSEEE